RPPVRSWLLRWMSARQSSAARPVVADAVDDADGMFGTRAHVDHSAPGAAFTRKCDLDARGPQERQRPPQSTGERSRRFWPAGRCSSSAPLSMRKLANFFGGGGGYLSLRAGQGHLDNR